MIAAAGQSMPKNAPRILYGTAWKKERTAACVQLALQTGFRAIDTACQPKHYHEPGVGEGLAAFLASPEAVGCTREEVYVQTKFTSLSGQDPKRVPYDARAALPVQVAQSVQASLKNLRVDYLDCLVLHSPLAALKSTVTVWHAMEEALHKGLVRQLGISNCYDRAQLEQLCQHVQVQPAVLQNRFYADTHYDRELRTLCRDRRIVYQSFWTLSANPHVLKHKVVKTLSTKHRRTPAQVFFRYLTLQGIAPLTGTQSLAHMREGVAIFDFELSADECAAVSALL